MQKSPFIMMQVVRGVPDSTRLKKNIFLPVGDFANNVGAQPRAQQCMAQHLGETPGVCLLDMNDTSQSRVVKFSAAGQRC